MEQINTGVKSSSSGVVDFDMYNNLDPAEVVICLEQQAIHYCILHFMVFFDGFFLAFVC